MTKTELEVARVRARAAAIAKACISGADRSCQERVAGWTLLGACQNERSLRMLCLELVASHLRTGAMDADRLILVLQQLYEFAVIPESPPREAAPVPRREDRPGSVARQTA